MRSRHPSEGDLPDGGLTSACGRRRRVAEEVTGATPSSQLKGRSLLPIDTEEFSFGSQVSTDEFGRHSGDTISYWHPDWPDVRHPSMDSAPFNLDSRCIFLADGKESLLQQPTQSALSALAGCWLAICSFIFCCISFGVGSAMWVATIHM